MSEQGYIKLHRKLLDNPAVCKDADHIAVWIYLLLSATHQSYSVMFSGKKIELKPGQLITGRKQISKKLEIDTSKVERILKLFKNEHQIEQQTSNRNRLISIVNWELYQKSEQQNEQQVNNKRTTSEQQVNTNKNVKNIKNVNNIYNKRVAHEKVPFSPPTLTDVSEYCQKRKNNIDAERFINYYEAVGWMIGNRQMKDWKAVIRNWEKGEKEKQEKPVVKKNGFSNFEERKNNNLDQIVEAKFLEMVKGDT